MKPISDLYILAVEITQIIQCIDPNNGYSLPDNSLELDSDRDTIIRVYIGHDGDPPLGTDSFSPALKDAKVSIDWIVMDSMQPMVGALLPTQMSSSFEIPWSADLNKLRNDARGSATFVIPAAQLGIPKTSKVLFVDASVSPPPGFVESNSQNNTMSVQIGGKDVSGDPVLGGLKPHKTLNVAHVPINYQPKHAYVSGGPDLTKEPNADSLMKKTYPMNVEYYWAGSFVNYGQSADEPAIQEDGMNNYESLLITLAIAKTFITPEPDALVGWLPKGANGPFAMRGEGTNAGNVAWVVDQGDDEANSLEVAHEVGHTLGVDHPDEAYGCGRTILEAGYDMKLKQPVPGNTWDYMCKNGPEGWISPVVWNRMLGNPCNCPNTGDIPSEKGQTWGPNGISSQRLEKELSSILLSGVVNRKGGRITKLYVIPTCGPFSKPDQEGPYCLEFKDIEGKVISSHCFKPGLTKPKFPKPSENALFFLRLPFPKGTKKVQLKRGKAILAERDAYSQSATLRIKSPNAKQQIKDRINISWICIHPNNAELRYTVLFSPDAGLSWVPIAIDQKERQLSVDLSLIRIGRKCKVRVLATDGFTTVTADSSLFNASKREQ